MVRPLLGEAVHIRTAWTVSNIFCLVILLTSRQHVHNIRDDDNDCEETHRLRFIFLCAR